MKSRRRQKKREQILSKGPRPGDKLPTMFGISVRDMNHDELISCVFEMQQTIYHLQEKIEHLSLDNRIY